jgi:hypothetical protein
MTTGKTFVILGAGLTGAMAAQAQLVPPRLVPSL